MTRSFFLLTASALLVACGEQPNSNGQEHADSTAAATPAVHYYGDTITADGAMAIADLMNATAGTDSLDAKVTCEIITSCKKKGCWMDVKLADGTPMTVRFKDYGFFVPTEGLEGKHAVIQGRAIRAIDDVATLKHKAEDEGLSKEEIAKITEPDTSWAFMADGVIIQD